MTKPLHIAEAKINLALEVLAKRPDGYHEINTIFRKIRQPHDIISIEASTGYLLTTNDRTLDTGSSNLITQAVQAVTSELNELMPRYHFHLAKRIPTGAGLGGGSSDAAIALKITNELFGSLLNDEKLFEIAIKLGADVPFFLSPARTAIATGIGELLTPIELHVGFHILIVKPSSVSISSKDAYRGLRLEETTTGTSYRELLGATLSIKNAKELFRNDFEAVLFEQNVKLPILKEHVYDLGADFVQMTGSGSAFFALFQDASIAHQASEALRAEGLQVFLNYTE
jgi:4-diphosphocytidyl-2-C-methyl-D-erythritol kinase